jgi:hypothetical protein
VIVINLCGVQRDTARGHGRTLCHAKLTTNAANRRVQKISNFLKLVHDSHTHNGGNIGMNNAADLSLDALQRFEGWKCKCQGSARVHETNDIPSALFAL